MSNVRFEGIYYNTTGPSIEWTIHICDTEAVAQVINIEPTAPVFSFEGLTQDIKPGIYTSSLKFGFYMRSSPKVRNGTTYGPSDSIITDLLGSNEGRFRVKLYKDGTLYFIGVILPDQCSWNDEDTPLFSITAVDGLYRLGSEDYVSEVGLIEYTTLESFAFDDSEFSATPLSAGLVGTEWVLIEHFSKILPLGYSTRKSTYARYEQYVIDSPGSGWVDQGGSLWAKEVDYFNEVIVDEATLYHLTRDIDNAVKRALSEYISRAMALIPVADEFTTGVDIMYDVINEWYETSMWSLVDDPYTQIRWNERLFATGKKWGQVIETILTHFYSRLYFANGRYHIEQISARGVENITRYCYDNEGTLIDTESGISLDLSYGSDYIITEAGGRFKMLAALRSAKVTVDLDDPNLLANQKWDLDHEGSRYLGRIKTSQTDTRLAIAMPLNVWAQFNNINAASQSFREQITAMHVYFDIRIQCTNTDTGSVFYLTPVNPLPMDWGTPTWETDPVNGYFTADFGIPGNPSIPPISNNTFTFSVLTDELPGSIGDSFDIYISVNFSFEFAYQLGTDYWEAHPGGYDLKVFNGDSSEMLLKDVDSNIVDAQVQRVYEVTNSTDNTVVVEYKAQFTDYGVGGDKIEVLKSASPIHWGRSNEWSIGGVVDGNECELLLLLARQIVSLRTVPLRVYSGGFMSTILTTENRLNRNSIIYLPLSLNVDTDVDSASGEFVNLERATPDNGGISGTPYEGNDPPIGIGGGGNGFPPNDQPAVLETNEAITGGPTLTDVDIINTLNVTIASGEIVKITNLTTGDYEYVTLTDQIDPGDTVMYFTSYTFVNDYPDGSPITIAAVTEENPQFPGLPWNYDNRNYTDSESPMFPDYYNFPDPEFNAPITINDRIKVYRNGTLMAYAPGAAGYGPPSTTYLWDIDYPARKLTFPLAFDGERLTINAK